MSVSLQPHEVQHTDLYFHAFAFELCITSSIRLGCLCASYFVLCTPVSVWSVFMNLYFHRGFPRAQTTATPVTHFEGN